MTHLQHALQEIQIIYQHPLFFTLDIEKNINSQPTPPKKQA